MAHASQPFDAQVIVVGGGVIGSACALRLAQAGRQVLLLNAGAPQQAASFGNAGHIATEQLFPLASANTLRASWRYLLDADSPLRIRPGYLLPILPWLARFVWAARSSGFARGVAALMALQQTALEDLAALLDSAAIGHLLHQRGHLEVWESEVGAAATLAQAERLGRHGVATKQLSAAAVRAQVPAISSAVQGGVHYLGSGHVDNPWEVCAGLHSALQRRGGQLRQGQAVQLQADASQGVGVLLQDGSRLRAEQLLLCAGAWSRPLAASLGYRVPLDTERGYHITVGSAATLPALACPVASSERKVIMTGMSVGLRMTGTVEFGGLKLPPDPRRFALLQQQLQALLPGVDASQCSTWMGFRPSLPDHLPVLGVAPRHSNVFFAFGHQHLGLTLSGVTARLMAELMLTGRSAVDLSPFAVNRF
jgi:D-amino-acid dehydrogenase